MCLSSNTDFVDTNYKITTNDLCVGGYIILVIHDMTMQLRGLISNCISKYILNFCIKTDEKTMAYYTNRWQIMTTNLNQKY